MRYYIYSRDIDINEKPIHDAIVAHKYRLTKKQEKYVKYKRVVDLIISTAGLFCLSIPFLMIIIAQKIDNPNEPVFFLQERIGKDNVPFKIIKFRTMNSTAPHNTATNNLENAEAYMTRFNKFLRKTSIDELPQLINVFKGEMSLIGPRPLIVDEQPIQYLREYYGVYSVRPGITGVAQVNGRDEVNDLDKIRYDRAYVKNICFGLDCDVILKSVAYVLHRKGIIEGKKEIKINSALSERVERDIEEAYCV